VLLFPQVNDPLLHNSITLLTNAAFVVYLLIFSVIPAQSITDPRPLGGHCHRVDYSHAQWGTSQVGCNKYL